MWTTLLWDLSVEENDRTRIKEMEAQTEAL